LLQTVVAMRVAFANRHHWCWRQQAGSHSTQSLSQPVELFQQVTHQRRTFRRGAKVAFELMHAAHANQAVIRKAPGAAETDRLGANAAG
jgi:hypothetical protein